MRVTVEFLSLPNISRIAGGRSVEIDFTGHTTADLLKALAQRYGNKVKDFLLDDSGKLDMTLRMMVNKKEWVPSDESNTYQLVDGDLVTIMMLVGGG